MGCYRILVVFKRHYYIRLKMFKNVRGVINDFIVRRYDPACEGSSKFCYRLLRLQYFFFSLDIYTIFMRLRFTKANNSRINVIRETKEKVV